MTVPAAGDAYGEARVTIRAAALARHLLDRWCTVLKLSRPNCSGGLL